VTLTVNADGTVKAVKINTKTHTNGTWEKCIADILKKLVFNAATDGKGASITTSITVTP
jgi:N-acetylglutamate synthase/N-acetylornithine aminotransferase